MSVIHPVIRDSEYPWFSLDGLAIPILIDGVEFAGIFTNNAPPDEIDLGAGFESSGPLVMCKLSDVAGAKPLHGKIATIDGTDYNIRNTREKPTTNYIKLLLEIT